MPRVHLDSDAERLEDDAQQDMRIRGMRLAAFVAKRDSCAWRYLPDLGEWHLVPVMDGSSTVDPK